MTACEILFPFSKLLNCGHAKYLPIRECFAIMYISLVVVCNYKYVFESTAFTKHVGLQKYADVFSEFD